MTDDLFSCAGKTILITGATRGLGLEMATEFARRGANLVVSSRKQAACDEVAKLLKGESGDVLPVAAHMGSWDDIERLVDLSYQHFGQVDVLINNAGMSPMAPSSAETSEVLFDKIIAVNLKGVFRLSALVGARMKVAGKGSIINISSVGALLPSPMFGPYAGAKAGLNAISQAMAIEYAPEVRVNVISPGGFLTDVASDWSDDEEALSGVLLQRFGQPNEIIGTVLYLASEASSFTTGANIRVDGGCLSTKR